MCYRFVITKVFTPICVLLTVHIVIAADNIGDTFLEFENDHVRGMYLYGTDVIGVLLDKEVYVVKFDDKDFKNLTEIAHIPLLKIFVYDNYNGLVLEFKLINETCAILCVTEKCCVTTLRPNLSANHFCFSLSEALKSVSAALADNAVILRLVNEADVASLDYVIPYDEKLEDPSRQSFDAPRLTDFVTVAAFSTGTHSYFVGSAKGLDLSLIPYYGKYGRKNTDLRITRFCNNDKTQELSSRIDLVLSCEGIDYNDVFKTVTNRATAALYLSESSKLLIAFQHGNFQDENYICSYNFTLLQSRFTETWDKCQNMPAVNGVKENCEKPSKSLLNLNLDEECFLYSWDSFQTPPYCSAYNEAMGDDQLDNCELHTSNNTINTFGALENFKPYDGKLVFKEKHLEPIVAIREIPNEGALYALRKDSRLIRLLTGDEQTSDVLTSVSAKSGKDLLQVLPNSNKVLFVPTHSNNTINVVESSCEGIYKTCQSIAWNDPLNCLYCANDDGSGTVVSDKLACPNNTTYQYVCPPIIIEATETVNDTYLITGIDFDNFLEDLEVKVCDSQCNLTSAVEPTSIHCSAEVDSTDTCVVKVTGSLNTTNSTFVNVTLSKQLQYSNKAMNNKWKTVTSITALLGMLVLICITCLCFSRHYDMDLKKTHSQDFNQLPLDTLYISMEDQLNPKDLVVLNTQPLGSGISATVYKGSFKTATGDYMPVAVKVLNNEYALLIEHSNIVNFIGHTYIDRTLRIVTEYMAGGSLYDYILNDDTPLKYQDTFDFMDQILSAMVYLSEQQIVHRDLAARNCLLNHDYTVLKVSDFGLARSVDFKGEYQILHDNALPTRWIAIEAFSLRKFTEKTDVWSFGVLVWELFTRGATPYDPLDHFQIQDFLKTGRRLQCPETCPDQIYALMITCWDGEPTKRPTFKHLQKDLSDRIRHLTSVNKQLIETGYERPNSRPLTN